MLLNIKRKKGEFKMNLNKIIGSREGFDIRKNQLLVSYLGFKARPESADTIDDLRRYLKSREPSAFIEEIKMNFTLEL